jgi:hypothetical protein
MTTGDTTAALSDWSMAIDELEVAHQTKLPPDVIRFCIGKGMVHPRQTEGRLLFPERDVLHLKLFRCVLYSRCLARELERCWQRASDQAMAGSRATLQKLPKPWLDNAEEALRQYRPFV